MTDQTNLEKLAGVLNQTCQQGKPGFVRMLWSNQPAEVQAQLTPLLSPEALDILSDRPLE